MIVLENVSKRYVKNHVPGKWVLQGVSLSIPRTATIGVVGDKAAGKSTLLKLVAGTELPTTGRVDIDARVGHPAKFMRSLQPLLSGRQNARFICRINGYAAELEERLARIEALARLGDRFDRPLKSYSHQMKARLSFALSWAFDFDIYVADSFDFAGATGFGDKDIAARELEERLRGKGLIMAPRRGEGEAQLGKRCRAGLWVHEGTVQSFERFEDALAAFRTAVPPGSGRKKSKGPEKRRGQEKLADVQMSAPEDVLPALARLKRIQSALVVLSRGVSGQSPVVDERTIGRIVRLGKDADLELVTREEMDQRGITPASGAVPIVRVASPGRNEVEYFDLKTQALPAGEPAQLPGPSNERASR